MKPTTQLPHAVDIVRFFKMSRISFPVIFQAVLITA